jgi:hypothetical protein
MWPMRLRSNQPSRTGGGAARVLGTLHRQCDVAGRPEFVASVLFVRCQPPAKLIGLSRSCSRPAEFSGRLPRATGVGCAMVIAA